jgi:hypothetical protein
MEVNPNHGDAVTDRTQQHRRGNGEQDAADDWARDAVARETRNAAAQIGAEQEHEAGREKRRQRVEADQMGGDDHADPTSAGCSGRILPDAGASRICNWSTRFRDARSRPLRPSTGSALC